MRALPNRWIRGAVRDRTGALVVSSQRLREREGSPLASANPRMLRVRDDVPLLEGMWMYGGQSMHNFGHFITETIATLLAQKN